MLLMLGAVQKYFPVFSPFFIAPIRVNFVQGNEDSSLPVFLKERNCNNVTLMPQILTNEYRKIWTWLYNALFYLDKIVGQDVTWSISYGWHIHCGCWCSVCLYTVLWHLSDTSYCVFLQRTAHEGWLWVRLALSHLQLPGHKSELFFILNLVAELILRPEIWADILSEIAVRYVI